VIESSDNRPMKCRNHPILPSAEDFQNHPVFIRNIG